MLAYYRYRYSQIIHSTQIGTNTYIVGKHNPYTLIDTGEGTYQYIQLLQSVFRETAKPHNATEPDVSHIILSHWHPDHINGLPAVLLFLRRLWEERNPSLPFIPPRLYKFPRTPNAPPCAFGGIPNTLPFIISSLPPDSYTPSPTGHVFHDLYDSQVITPLALRVLHTPGHTEDSIALYIPPDRALFTGDNVLGQGTAAFENLTSYLQSLEYMLQFANDDSEYEMDGMYKTAYPGHGPVIHNAKEFIMGYIKHRLDREVQILKLLKSPPLGITGSPSTHWTTWMMVREMYVTHPESLWLSAAHIVGLHLRKLEGENVVRWVVGEGKDASWELADIPSSGVFDHYS